MNNGIHSEIKDRAGIEAFGFRYAEDDSKCRGHFFNGIPVELDLRELPEYELAEVDKDIDKIFRSVLKWELEDTGVKAVREITWDRVFFVENWWDPRWFTVRFWVRIVGEDAVPDSDSHVTRV